MWSWIWHEHNIIVIQTVADEERVFFSIITAADKKASSAREFHESAQSVTLHGTRPVPIGRIAYAPYKTLQQARLT